MCQLLAAGPTCRRHVGNFPSQGIQHAEASPVRIIVRRQHVMSQPLPPPAATSFGTGGSPPLPSSLRWLSSSSRAAAATHALLARTKSAAAAAASARTVHGEPPPLIVFVVVVIVAVVVVIVALAAVHAQVGGGDSRHQYCEGGVCHGPSKFGKGGSIALHLLPPPPFRRCRPS